MADALPWLNLLLVPMVGLLLRIEGRLSALEANRAADRDRIKALERRMAGQQ